MKTVGRAAFWCYYLFVALLVYVFYPERRHGLARAPAMARLFWFRSWNAVPVYPRSWGLCQLVTDQILPGKTVRHAILAASVTVQSMPSSAQLGKTPIRTGPLDSLLFYPLYRVSAVRAAKHLMSYFIQREDIIWVHATICTQICMYYKIVPVVPPTRIRSASVQYILAAKFTNEDIGDT